MRDFYVIKFDPVIQRDLNVLITDVKFLKKKN